MTNTASPVGRNGAAVLIFIVGAGGFVASLLHALLQNNVGAISEIFVLLFSYSFGVIGVLIAAILLSFGTRRFVSIVGDSGWGRVALCAWAILNAASQVAYVGYLSDGATHVVRAHQIQMTIAIATLLVGLLAATFVLRGHVATGFAAVSLFVALILYAASGVLLTINTANIDAFVDLPRLVGLALLGLSYWRVGVLRAAGSPSILGAPGSSR